tara:strand:+ start:549 stop:944 length:396 start_codon:yes stop_codon:yes gene_type:complete
LSRQICSNVSADRFQHVSADLFQHVSADLFFTLFFSQFDEQFKQMLTAKKEVWWETSDKLLWSQLVQRQKPGQIRLSSMRNRMSRESAALSQLNPLGRLKNSGNKFQGSINLLDHFHFVIVAGDAWKKEKP